VIVLAIVLILIISFAHSYLGEKYIITRLLKRDLPKLFGSDDFTKKTLRFAWHITTIAWLGFAYALYLIKVGSFSIDSSLTVTSVVFGFSGMVSLIASKGKHLSWVVFFTIAFCCWGNALG